MFHNIYERKISPTNHSESALKTLFHGIGIYMLQNNVVANVQEAQQVTLEFTCSVVI